jgi:hypothetical protein
MSELQVIAALGAPGFDESRQRLNTAYDMYKDTPSAHVITTGNYGVFTTDGTATVPMALEMRDNAIGRLGLSEEAVTAARTSLETIRTWCCSSPHRNDRHSRAASR